MKSKHLRFTTTVKLRTFGSRLRYFVGAVFAVCALLLVVSPLANAQATGQATISGIVTDTSGSVIANARLTITNVQTGVSADSVTNATGYFVVKGLNPGIYKVSVASAGFRTLLREGITVEADSTVNLPLRLATGSVTETVTVTGDAAQLNTESGSSGQILTTRQVQSLPASGSNPAWLLEMAPGVQSWLNQTSSTDGTLSWNGPSNFASLGNRDVNEYSLDGAPNMQARNNAVNPTGDETGEMKLDVVALDASVGHTMGANITQTTKAGREHIWLAGNPRK